MTEMTNGGGRMYRKRKTLPQCVDYRVISKYSLTVSLGNFLRKKCF